MNLLDMGGSPPKDNAGGGGGGIDLLGDMGGNAQV